MYNSRVVLETQKKVTVLCHRVAVKMEILFPQVFTETAETAETESAERKEAGKQSSTEEDVSQKEALDR